MIKNTIKGVQHLATYRKRSNDKEQVVADYKKYFEDSKTNDKNRTKVEMAGVTKVYDNGIKALSNLSMTIEPGEFVVLLGPSGCGKTTLLRMIAGLESISDGYIKFNGAIVNGLSPKDREIAMVFQNYALYPFMTVAKNISFGLKNKLYSNNVYRKLKHDVKMAENPYYDRIQDAKTELKLLKKPDSYLSDTKKRFQRLLKTAKLHKDESLIAEYTGEIEKVDGQIKERLEDPKTKEQIETLKIVLEALKSRSVKYEEIIKLSTELKVLTSSEKSPENEEQIKTLKAKIAELKAEKVEIDQAKVEELLDEKYKSAKVWYDYIPEKIEEVTSMLGINMYTKRKPADLSGGQRQRVALARAISKQTGLFLYDEPLSNLDAKLRARMRTEIRRIHNTLGSTSVYVTHDQLEAMSMADKIVVMNKGYIQQVGTPLELLEKPSNLFVAKFIGNTDVNIIPVDLKAGKIKTKSGAAIKSTIMNGKIDKVKLPKKIVMAFRPEHTIVDPQIVSNFKDNVFTGKIEHLELLGNDVLLTTKVPKIGEIRIMSTIAYSHKVGDEVKFVINPNKIHLYDDVTGFNLFEKFDEQNEYAKEVWLNDVEERKKNIFLMNKEKQKMSKSELLGLYMISPISTRAKTILEDRKKDIDYGDQLKAQ